MTKKDKYIARCIINAQNCSDAGKYIAPVLLNRHDQQKAKHSKYIGKTRYILNALDVLSKTKGSMFTFYVRTTRDQNGYPSVLTYFEFKIGEERHQVSFHTPIGSLTWDDGEHFNKYIGKGRRTHWNHDLNGSIKSCFILQEVITM